MKYVLFFIFVLTLSGCSSYSEGSIISPPEDTKSSGMEGAPCHQMPNGMMMGDC